MDMVISATEKRLRQCPLARRQSVGMTREDHQRLESVAHRVAARHQHGSGGRADRRAIERVHADAFVGELVDVGRLDRAAAIADIGEAEIVGHDENDIGLAHRLRKGGQGRR